MARADWTAMVAVAIAIAGCRTPGVPADGRVQQENSAAASRGSDWSREEYRAGANYNDRLAPPPAEPPPAEPLPHEVRPVQAPQVANGAVRLTSYEAGRRTDVEMPAPTTPLPLTLDRAIGVALARNPDLIALRASEPVAHAAFHAAEVYPWNPSVHVHVDPYTRDRSGDLLAVKNAVELMQTLELAHQQRHRESSAAAAWSQVRWSIVQAELSTTAQTERLYFTALYQRALRDLARRTADLDEQLRGIAERRFQAGLGQPADRLTARVNARQSRRQADLAEIDYRVALLALQRQLNLPEGETIQLRGELADYNWLSVADVLGSNAGESGRHERAQGPSEEAVDQLAQGRPDVLAADSAVAVARADARLARANQVQNVDVGPSYERDESGTLFFGVLAQMNLPVWDSGRPLTRQRLAEENHQRVTYEQLRSRARVEIRTALDRYEVARSMLVKQEPHRTGFAAAELTVVKDQFLAGQADILSVLAVQNSLLQDRRDYFDMWNQVAQAAADVTLAAGLPPARLAAAPSAALRQPELLPAP